MSVLGIRLVADRLAEAASGNGREVLLRLADGQTLALIGEEMGFTRERARQIAEKAASRAAESLGVEIPSGEPEPPPMEFSRREPLRKSEGVCIDCGGITVPGHRLNGRCAPCDQRWRMAENIGGRRDRQMACIRKYNEKVKAMAIADENQNGVSMRFGKKPIPDGRGFTSKWSPILERARSLEPGDWFSVDLPTPAMAKAARSAVMMNCRGRWPKSLPDEQRRDYRFATEQSTLFVKRER